VSTVPLLDESMSHLADDTHANPDESAVIKRRISDQVLRSAGFGDDLSVKPRNAAKRRADW
jgi:hypothetical protein